LTPRHVAGALKEGIRIFRGFIVSFVISFVSSARLDFSRPEALGDLTQPLLRRLPCKQNTTSLQLPIQALK
jgi:hypothetical protein|tara:strand:+ start:697 stop:909 length:213 start_codon:yes stop_codon:yes gene_type:complete